jgi:peptidoglycan/LPS O-acetylase OafA/YrhL
MVAQPPADYGPVATVTTVLSGADAVDCFFVISGYLIFQRYNRSRTVASYAVKRAKRIYPALVVVLICAIAGAALTTLPLGQYVQEPLRYTAFNLLFMTFRQQTLPGMFENAAFRKHRIVLVPGANVALALCAVFGNLSFTYPLYPGALAILVIYVCALLPRLANIGKYGDFSYGLHIVH